MPGRPTAEQVAGWADEAGAVGDRIGRHFARSEPRRRAAGYVRGLLSDAEREDGRHLAEHLGDPTPDGVRHLPARAGWDADAVRDDLAAYVADRPGDPGGVLVVDETGSPKKGTKSCGVARQYTGPAGRIENCQVGVFLGHVAPRGRALTDRPLYRPKEWAGDAGRGGAAGAPGGAAFATNLVLARRTIGRAAAAGVPAAWVPAAAVYGAGHRPRTALEGRGSGHAAGVRSDSAVCIEWRRGRAKTLLAAVPDDGGRRVSCGLGAEGPRGYGWALVPADCPRPREYPRWVLIRRCAPDPAEVAYSACGGPPSTTLAAPVRVAGMRWAVEECFEPAKGDRGPDGHEVRPWAGWHRRVTLSLFALAVVAVIRSRVPAPRRKRGAGSWSG